MTKMPVEYFNYYTLLEPYATGYYQTGQPEKARSLLNTLIKKYQENLTYYKGLSLSEQNHLSIDIVTDIERYRSLLYIMKDEKDMELYESSRKTFNQYNEMFKRFEREAE